MYLSSLQIEQFRNYHDRIFSFQEPTTLIVGDNASGKTNILEAVYLLATAKSFRAQRIEEMIFYDQPLARVKGSVALTLAGEGAQQSERTLEILLTRGEIQGRRVAKRRYQVDGVAKRYADFAGTFSAVLFRPEDLDIILGTPHVRRRFLDDVISQVDRDYRRSLVSYEKALIRRNRILDAIREREVPRTQLTFWDQLLIKHGQLLTQKRTDFIEMINTSPTQLDSFRVKYDSSTISAERLGQYAEQEVAVGFTLVGPHKDDFSVEFEDGKALVQYGSRGEQRLAVLWLKLAELSFISNKKRERPVLLLDDIFSELDQGHRALVMKVILEQQTLITTTDLHFIEAGLRKDFPIIALS